MMRHGDHLSYEAPVLYHFSFGDRATGYATDAKLNSDSEVNGN